MPSGCKRLWDLERYAIRHHVVLTEALEMERHFRSQYRYFFHRVDDRPNL